MKLEKFAAVGCLIGLILGVLLYVIFPGLLSSEFTVKEQIRVQRDIPDFSLNVRSGSKYSRMIIPLYSGIAGGLTGLSLGFIIKKLKRE